MALHSSLQQIGLTSGIAVAQSAPTLATDGFDTRGERFCNVNVVLTAGTSCDVQIYLYNGANWVLYTDVPTTTVLSANGGGLFQLEIRGQPRIFARITNLVGAGASVNVFATAVTY